MNKNKPKKRDKKEGKKERNDELYNKGNIKGIETRIEEENFQGKMN